MRVAITRHNRVCTEEPVNIRRTRLSQRVKKGSHNNRKPRSALSWDTRPNRPLIILDDPMALNKPYYSILQIGTNSKKPFQIIRVLGESRGLRAFQYTRRWVSKTFRKTVQGAEMCANKLCSSRLCPCNRQNAINSPFEPNTPELCLGTIVRQYPSMVRGVRLDPETHNT